MLLLLLLLLLLCCHNHLLLGIILSIFSPTCCRGRCSSSSSGGRIIFLRFVRAVINDIYLIGLNLSHFINSLVIVVVVIRLVFWVLNLEIWLMLLL